jgi:hypothetical protein
MLNYYFYLNNFKIKVSKYSYIYITGHDLEECSMNLRLSFSYAVRTLYEKQSTL